MRKKILAIVLSLAIAVAFMPVFAMATEMSTAGAEAVNVAPISGSELEAQGTLPYPENFRVYVYNGYAKLKWNPIEGASSYIVWIYTSKPEPGQLPQGKMIKGIKKASYKTPKLSKKKAYYFSVAGNAKNLDYYCMANTDGAVRLVNKASETLEKELGDGVVGVKYKFYYNKKGKLVGKITFRNTGVGTIKTFSNMKLSVKDRYGGLLGSQKFGKKTVKIAEGATKTLTFTFKKAKKGSVYGCIFSLYFEPKR